MSLPTTGILDNYNLRYNFGTAQLEMNTGNEVWVGVPANLVDFGLANTKILVGNAGGVATAVSMSGGATIDNTGAVSLTATSVTGALLTGYVSGAGTVAATDTILQGFNKLNGNQALYLPLAGGTLTGQLNMTSAGNPTLRMTGNSSINTDFVVEKGNNSRLYLQNNGATMMIWDGSAGSVSLSSAPLFGGSQDLRTNAAISAGTQSPSSKAQLQADSTTKGFLEPRMTTTQRDAISSPDEGMQIYNTTTHQMNVYNGSAWVPVAAGSAATPNYVVNSTIATDIYIANDASFTDSTFGVTITPSSSSAAIRVTFPNVQYSPNGTGSCYFTIFRGIGGVDLGGAGAIGLANGDIPSGAIGTVCVDVVDTPSTTSPVVYQLYVKSSGLTALRINDVPVKMLAIAQEIH